MLEKILSFFGRSSIGAARKILVVDDGEVERKFMSSTLEKKGFRVSLAENGEVGVEKAQKEKPDLIILDLVMPGMDGKQVCEKLKSDEQTKDIPIVFLTGSANSTDLVECYEVGADYYLEKPISGHMLLKQINLTFEEQQTPVKE